MMNIAIVLSSLSLLISGAALGWNVYKELGLRARVRVALQNSQIALHKSRPLVKRVTLSITNLGPGKCRANGLHLRKTAPWWRFWARSENQYAFLLHDYEDPLCPKFPCELEAGENVILTFRPELDIFFYKPWQQIGVADSFGVIHWCSKKHFAQIKTEFHENQRRNSVGTSESLSQADSR